MKRNLILSLVAFFLLLIGCRNYQGSRQVLDENSKEQFIKRGKYLVSVIGCSDCHSPKKMGPNGPETDSSLFLSGYPEDAKLALFDKNLIKQGWLLSNGDFTAMAGPWGVSFAANITSDPTGIGNWPEENFIRAMRKGKYKGIEGTRTLLPPMPWEDFSNFNDYDVKSIYAFLITVKPIHNIVPLAIAP